jgi:hypothetical protein
MNDKSLSVSVEGTSIVVTMPGTSFRATFFKTAEEPRLTQSSAMSVEKEAPAQTRTEFETFAWEAANAKARELGWI